MTNNESTPRPTTAAEVLASAPRYARRIPQKEDFAPLDRKADTSRNAQRGTPPRRKLRTIL